MILIFKITSIILGLILLALLISTSFKFHLVKKIFNIRLNDKISLIKCSYVINSDMINLS